MRCQRHTRSRSMKRFLLLRDLLDSSASVGCILTNCPHCIFFRSDHDHFYLRFVRYNLRNQILDLYNYCLKYSRAFLCSGEHQSRIFTSSHRSQQNDRLDRKCDVLVLPHPSLALLFTCSRALFRYPSTSVLMARKH